MNDEIEERKERKKCERMLERVVSGVITRFAPDMNTTVRVMLLGREDYKMRVSRQTTLHEYADIGIAPNVEAKLDYLDVQLNRTLLDNPNIGEVITRMIDDLEIKMMRIRQTG
tara:strand:+ start:413 stop:751 length:339 start_codon:yes stop_codon:yes gene_type:complete